MSNFTKKISNYRSQLAHFADFLETVAATIVCLVVIAALISLVIHLPSYYSEKFITTTFYDLLEIIFNLVIGIVFMKMLCRPHTGNIIETLILLMSKKIIMEHTTAMDDLLIVIAICLLFFFRRFMLATRPDENDNSNNFFAFFKRFQGYKELPSEEAVDELKTRKNEF